QSSVAITLASAIAAINNNAMCDNRRSRQDSGWPRVSTGFDVDGSTPAARSLSSRSFVSAWRSDPFSRRLETKQIEVQPARPGFRSRRAGYGFAQRTLAPLPARERDRDPWHDEVPRDSPAGR